MTRLSVTRHCMWCGRVRGGRLGSGSSIDRGQFQWPIAGVVHNLLSWTAVERLLLIEIIHPGIIEALFLAGARSLIEIVFVKKGHRMETVSVY